MAGAHQNLNDSWDMTTSLLVKKSATVAEI